ncbi:MAG: hypothetical protein GTO45_00150 [Candidatus Aminicenantes bacterium]|nr:hypothetical protein [Candidatus Aminicenantes bacterium]NIM77178.1 hypothetical protein [Candidatus Aminicenantes bacterium]NIN16471.1 hypothetical protein [Candidatus Aminicenantes bacterium]NIN40332.1 hypothetical protein [Candidatus Aminicenantes bacterium]NIN83151.1 hypothetical protein [Candidatus Aminicenantes bacterium]
MNTDKIVLFYPTGIVHYRNLEILKKNLPGFKFQVIVEPWVKEKAAEVLDNIEPEDHVPVENDQVPEKVWQEHIDILFLSMAYPNPFRLHLVDEAAKRNIPVIAIEEVNQLALNDGIINHYFLPLDYLGVPSQVEKEKFMELGLSEDAVMVTGWPFFNKEAALASKRKGENDSKKQYQITGESEKKYCLLVLGSLKEQDIVSLETRRVRQKILEIVSAGLPEDYRLLIKPHPIETESGLEDIRKQVPDAVLLNPKYPIEPLLARADVVVNRGNSQVTLLAMLQDKPVIVIPAGLKTIFHGTMDPIIANSALEFNRILEHYSRGQKQDYQKILNIHFPLTQQEALKKVNELFSTALNKKVTERVNETKRIYISTLYAFLGHTERAKQLATELPEGEIVSLLKKLFNRLISVSEFRTLLGYFPGKIIRWHLQSLFIRSLLEGKAAVTRSDLLLLEGFGGDVNPHYFIEDIMKRIELEYRGGNEAEAEEWIHKFYEDYSVFDYYKQVFDMLRFVYQGRRKGWSLRKALWLLKNFNKAYARKYVKDKLKK